MPPAIQIEDLTKVFQTYGREIRALNGVSFNVEPGELFGLFGPNGAGKSTLVRILATLVTPTLGTAFVNGFNVLNQELQARASFGLVTADERSFYGRLTARDNLAYFASLQNVPRARINNRVREVVDLFALGDKLSVPFQSLSTGQRQRLNMARALLHDPPILFLDEPTKSMDVETSRFVKALIKDELVARQGKTVIFISHEVADMEQFCDRVGILSHGRLRAIGPPDTLGAGLPDESVYRIEIQGDIKAISAGIGDLPGIASVRPSAQAGADAFSGCDVTGGANIRLDRYSSGRGGPWRALGILPTNSR